MRFRDTGQACQSVPRDLLRPRRASRSRRSPARAGVRRRLQPRAVAGRGVARGRAADARGRGHLRHRRGLLLGASRARAGASRLRLARRGARPPRGPRRRGRPRHRHRLTAAVAVPPPPRGAAGRRRRPSPAPRQPADVVPQLAGLPRAVAGPGRRGSPSATATTRRCGCGTCPTSSAATTPTATATSARRRSAAGSRSGTATSAGLNRAWGTDFWSQRYSDFDEIGTPRTSTAQCNPTQLIDFRRFSSEELLDQHRAERDLLHRLSPGVPVTTNVMVTHHIDALDYWRWAPELDLVSQDHYLDGRLEDPHVELSFCADWTRGLAGGDPWLLMEHSTSAVNWQPHNYPKAPGQMARNSLQHVARGADAVGFFQWRASRAGAEKYHSALLPHAGTDTRVWREVVELGATLGRLAELAGTRVRARVALLLDFESRWAVERDSLPSSAVTYLDRPHAFYRALWDAGVTVDVRHPDDDLSGYALVIAPTLHIVGAERAAHLTAYVEAGGHLLTTYFSGIVDENDHVHLGGYPGALRDLLGVRVEEFCPLPPGTTVGVSVTSAVSSALSTAVSGGGDTWVEDLHLRDAEAWATATDGPLPGRPVVTRVERGAGRAWYVATRTDPGLTAAVVGVALAEAGVAGEGGGHGVEVVRRHGEDRRYALVLNHTDRNATLDLHGTDLVTGQPVGRPPDGARRAAWPASGRRPRERADQQTWPEPAARAAAQLRAALGSGAGAGLVRPRSGEPRRRAHRLQRGLRPPAGAALRRRRRDPTPRRRARRRPVRPGRGRGRARRGRARAGVGRGLGRLRRRAWPGRCARPATTSSPAAASTCSSTPTCPAVPGCRPPTPWSAPWAGPCSATPGSTSAPPTLAQVVRTAENDYVGAPTGIMDQMASLHGVEGHVLFLDTRTLEVEPVAFDAAAHGLALLVVDTRAPHALVDGEYAERRASCEQGARGPRRAGAARRHRRRPRRRPGAPRGRRRTPPGPSRRHRGRPGPRRRGAAARRRRPARGRPAAERLPRLDARRLRDHRAAGRRRRRGGRGRRCSRGPDDRRRVRRLRHRPGGGRRRRRPWRRRCAPPTPSTASTSPAPSS